MNPVEQEPDLAGELRHARSAIWTVAQMGGASATLLMQYIGWFAPTNGKLRFAEIAAHLAAVQAMFNDSTAAEWQTALRQMLADKVAGSLKTPLTNHLALEDYLAAARASLAGASDGADGQPETSISHHADVPNPPDRPASSYPAGTLLIPKPAPPPASQPPSAAQKAKAHELCQAMKQACRAAK